RLTNTGVVDLPEWDPAAFTDDLSDVLDDAVIVAGPTASSGTASLVDTELRWHGALAAGESVEVVYTVELGGTAGDRVLRNTAVVDPSLAMRWNDGECPDGEAVCAPPERAVQTETGVRALTVSKVADTGSAGAGDVVTYEVTVTNTGTA